MLRGMWDLPGPGLEPVSLALAGGFLTTAPPGKSHVGPFCSKRFPILLYRYRVKTTTTKTHIGTLSSYGPCPTSRIKRDPCCSHQPVLVPFIQGGMDEARSQKPGEGGLSFSSATSQLWHFLPLGLSTLILKGGCWVISKVLLELIPLYYRTMFRDSGNTCPSQTSDSGQERVLSSTNTPVPNAQPLSRASSTGISISQECPV